MLSNLFEKIRSRKTENGKVFAKDLRGWIERIGDAELNGESLDLKPHEIDHCSGVVEAAGFSDADFRASIAEYKRRFHWCKQAAALKAREEAAIKADREAVEFEAAEGERHRKAHEKGISLTEAARIAQSRFDEAVEARSNLIAKAVVTPEERELTKQQAAVNERIAALRAQISPRLPNSIPDYRFPSIHQYPGALAAQRRSQLANKKITAEHRSELEGLLKLAEAAVAVCQSELAKVEKQSAALTAQLVALNDAKLLPESFPLVKARRSFDERAQQHAKEFWFGEKPVQTAAR